MVSASAALSGCYDYTEVARSVLVAIFASYAALDLAGRVTATRGRARLAWLSGGAIAMGIGIWAMHFKGMLAFLLPVPVEYHWPTVLASLLVAVLASAVALYVSSRHKMGAVEAFTGSIGMSAGIAGMHYIGMAAMRLPAITRYSPLLVTCSILLAILFSLVALLMAFGLREETRWSVPRRLGSATVMGVAVSAMHYTGMAAATFIPASPPDLSHAVSIPPVGNSGVVMVALIVLVAAATTSSLDRRRGEHRIRLVIDTAPAMLHSARPDGYVDFFNKRWLEFVGASFEEIEGWRWTNVVHPEDVEDVVDRWRSSLATGRPFEAEARLRRADEEYRLMLLRKVPLRDEAGSIVKWYGSATDIEDRKRAEQDLKVSEERYRVIVQAASDAVISMDEHGSILLANPATARIFGYDRFELIGKPLTVLMPEFLRKLHEAGFRRYLATGQRHLNWQGTELTALRKNGQEFPVELSFGEMTSNGRKVFTGFIRDISQKKRAEDELRRQKEVFQKIFENIPVTISFIGQDGHIELVNPEWERTFGWTLEETRKQNLDLFAEFYPDPQYRQMVKDDIAASTGEWIDRKVTVKDGRVIDLAVAVVHLSDGTSIAIGRDITERKRAEQAHLRLASIVESSDDAIISKDMNGIIASWNASAERIFGYTGTEAVGQPITIIIPPALWNEEHEILRRLRTGDHIQHYETIRVTKQGNEVNVSLTISPMRNSEGQVVGASKIARDITEQKRAEQSLLLFRMLIDQSNDAIEVIDPETLRFIDINGRACLDLGYSREELMSLTVHDVDPFADELMLTVTGDLQNSGSAVFESFHRRKDGSTFPVEISVKQVQLDRVYRVSVVRDITERKRAEEALRSAAEFDEAALKSLGEGLYTIDINGLVTSMNPAAEELFGWSFAELRGKNMHEMTHHHYPDGRPFPSSECAGFQVLMHGQPLKNYEDVFIRKDGTFFDVVYSIAPMRDAAGRISSLVVVVRDITARKRAEEELRKQKELFQKIFENIPVIITFRGQDLRVEMVNPEFERVMGWTLKEIRGQNLDIYAAFFPDQDYRQMVLDLLAASTGEWKDLKVSVKDGRVIDVATAFVRLSDRSTLGIGQDVTERKRTEAELRESEARFRLVADSAPVMIWMSGTDKLFIYFNKPWLDFTGRSLEQELGNGWAEAVNPEDLGRCLDTYTQAFDRREAFRMEYRLRRHDGEYRWVSDTGVPRFNPDGSFAGYIGSCIDITEQRQSEEQLRQAHENLARVTRLAAMGELAAAIAHEINQPLTAIVTNGGFCLRQIEGEFNPDELGAAITEIVSDASRASAVISRVRSLLRDGTSRRTELDINQIIQEVAMLLRTELNRNRVSLHTDLAAGLPGVYGDPVQLQQVLINLVMNAIEAMRSSTQQPRMLLIRSAKNSHEVLVQVQDSGPGIEPEVANRIFEPFFTTKPEGTGMGLSISHSIIESHGGRLQVVPSSKGAVFEFTIPADREGAA